MLSQRNTRGNKPPRHPSQKACYGPELERRLGLALAVAKSLAIGCVQPIGIAMLSDTTEIRQGYVVGLTYAQPSTRPRSSVSFDVALYASTGPVPPPSLRPTR